MMKKLKWRLSKEGSVVPADQALAAIIINNSVLVPELLGALILNNVLYHFKVAQPNDAPELDKILMEYNYSILGTIPKKLLLDKDYLEDETKLPSTVLQGITQALQTNLMPGSMRLIVKPILTKEDKEPIFTLELSWISYKNKN